MNYSALKKTLLARFRASSPEETSKKLGVSAFALVMFVHGYSKPQGRTIAKIEKKLGGQKSVRAAAKRA